MFVIAVTGGLGSGKSTACEYFRSRGAIILDLDQIAHAVAVAGSDVHKAIVEEFGEEVVAADGSIDREKLAGAAFSEGDASRRLNEIVHPVVLRELMNGINDLRLMERPPQVVVVEIPLLVEAPVFSQVVDTVLALSAPEEERFRRAVAAGMSEADARRRMARQASDAARAALASRVIANVGNEEEFLAKLERYWSEVAPRGT